MQDCIAMKSQMEIIEHCSLKMQEFRVAARLAQTDLPEEYEQYQQTRKNIMTEAWWHKVENSVNTFQREVNNLLGQTIKTVYVATSGRGKSKQVNIYELPVTAVTKPGINSHNQVVGRYRPTLTYLRSKAINLTHQEQQENDQWYKSLSETYIEAIRRFDKMKNNAIAGFYWSEGKGKKAGYISVSNRGDIGEAFAQAVLQEHKIQMSKNIEGNLKRFASLVAQVDSISGLLQGDIKGKNGVQYAAKTYGASTMGIDQAIQLAQEILSGQIVNVTDLQNKQKQYIQQGSLRNHIVTDINEEVEILIKDLLKGINKT